MRRRQLEQVQMRFAAQQQKVVDLQSRLSDIQQEIREQLKSRPEESVDPLMSRQRFGYIQHLKLQAEHLQTQIQAESQILEHIREEMRQAHVRKKSLELLEEKQRKAYLKNLEIQMEKEIEDLVVARYHHG